MKQLSELLAEVEPEWHDTNLSVKKHQYDKLKAIAVELAKALEFYGTLTVAKKTISDARKMLGDGG